MANEVISEAMINEGALAQAATIESNAVIWHHDCPERPNADIVLLVEDEAFVRKVTCEVLRAAGYRVLTAKNAEEAKQVYDLHRGNVALLLSDVILPGENGRALARVLKRENPELKVLMITGYAEQMGACAAREECLAKPFSSVALLRKVGQMLDTRGAPAAQRRSA